MLRHDTWTRLFQAAADVVGKQISSMAPRRSHRHHARGFSFPAGRIWTFRPLGAALARA
jgi:hypothetical protein